MLSTPDPAQGVKHDQGKPAMELLPPRALVAVGEVLGYGARKYAPENWRHVRPVSRYTGAALRHIAAHTAGERLDPESGLPHLAHAATCLLFLIELDTVPEKHDGRGT